MQVLTWRRGRVVSVLVIDSEQCEEAYGELLCLRDAKEQQSVPPHTRSAGAQNSNS